MAVRVRAVSVVQTELLAAILGHFLVDSLLHGTEELQISDLLDMEALACANVLLLKFSIYVF